MKVEIFSLNNGILFMKYISSEIVAKIAPKRNNKTINLLKKLMCNNYNND
jgi:hypothetical protein